MRSMVLPIAIGLGLSSAAGAQPTDVDYRRASDTVIALAKAAQSVPGASPALAVVTVRGSGPPTIWVEGTIAAGGAARANPDTPFYIASMTKPYVGLLAVELDRKGLLPLDTRLDEVWPGLAIAEVPQAGAVTMRELLSHRVPFRVPTLNERTAYTDDVPAKAYRALIEKFAEPHDAAYSYSNLGYLLYGAAAELRTGRHWRDLLKEHVTAPLALDRTSSRISDFEPSTVTLGHQWLIDRFHPVGKSDALMHAAGGLVSSPGDLATWLQAWLSKQGGSIPAASYAAAATVHSSGEEKLEGIACTGYSLGWHQCGIGGAAVNLHGGGYPGVRAAMGWSEELDAGIAILSNSDSMTGGLSAQLLRLFFTALDDPSAEIPPPAAFAERYGEMVISLAEGRKREVAESRALPEWQGWAWKPDAARLRSFAGSYASPRLGRLIVTYGAEGLSGRIGEYDVTLEPAAENLFAASTGPTSPLEPVRVETGPDGRSVAIIWDEDRFVRVD